jgi:hypothetical protein
MNTGYLLYQAERAMTPAEQREVDIWHAQFAAAVSRLWHSLTTPPRRRGRLAALSYDVDAATK